MRFGKFWHIIAISFGGSMAKTIAFHLQKGGVGKTTISGTLACQSAINGHNTLVIDCDPQGNLSSWFLTQPPKYELSDVLQGKCFVEEAIIKAPELGNLSILPTFGIGGTLKNYSETKLAEEPFVIQDLVKALNYISGNRFDQELQNFLRENNVPWGEWTEWGYFRIKGFKKGTMHFEFLDENIWMEFNRRIAKIKGWALPKKTGKPSRKHKTA